MRSWGFQGGLQQEQTGQSTDGNQGTACSIGLNGHFPNHHRSEGAVQLAGRGCAVLQVAPMWHGAGESSWRVKRGLGYK